MSFLDNISNDDKSAFLLLIFSDRSGGGGGPGGMISSCQSGTKIPGEGNNKLLRYPFLENPMVRGAWLAMVHGIV